MREVTLGDLKDGNYEFIYKRGVRTWDISMAGGCNLACSYCYASCNTVSPEEGGVLSWDNIVKMVDLMKKYHEHEPDSGMLIKLYGGEPLLNKNLIRCIDLLWDTFKDVGYPNFNVVVITNGTLLSDNLISELKRCRDKMGMSLGINISVDGYKENHDTYRVDKKGNPTYDIINEKISKFGTKYDRLVVTQGVLTPNMLINSDKLFDALREVRITYPGCRRIFGILPMNDMTFSTYSTKEIKEMFKIFEDNIMKNLDLLETNEFMTFQFDRIITSSLTNKYKTDPQHMSVNFCNAGSMTFSIMSNGDVYPCHVFYHDGHTEMCVGNIGDLDIEQKMLSIKKKWEKLTQAPAQCKTCKLGMINGIGCIGGCIGHNYHYYRENKIPHHVCVYNKCMYDLACKIYEVKPELFLYSITVKED